jgi:hypothetical protein
MSNHKLKQSLIEDYPKISNKINPNINSIETENLEYRTLTESVWQSLVSKKLN